MESSWDLEMWPSSPGTLIDRGRRKIAEFDFEISIQLYDNFLQFRGICRKIAVN